MPRKPAVHRPPGAAAARQARQQQADRDRQHLPHRKILSSSRWQRFRKWFLTCNPVCGEEGCHEPAEHAHHLKKLADRPDLAFDEENILALCERHHNQRTARGE